MRLCRFVQALVLCLVVVFQTSTALAQKGTRPRGLAVRSDGTVLVTSMGSNCVTQLTWNGTSFDPPLHIDIGARSWGVCLTDDATAVVTLPFEDALAVLSWDAAAKRWTTGTAIVNIPRYCTELISDPQTGRIFIANRGRKPAVPGAEEWQHAVYELDINGVIARTYVTDREPRALAFSPDHSRLFVGHVQGALGGPAVDATSGADIVDHPLSNPIYDGGSVMVFAIQGGSPKPLHRFGVGSPVRGLAVLPVSGGRYRVYFSHVGYGAAGEDAQFGGRDIPNLITSIAFDIVTNEPVGVDRSNPLHRQDFALGHAPDGEARRAILHEKLVVRQTGVRNELWITNSGSGTVSRVRLDADGLVDSDGSVTISFPRIRPGVGRADGGWLLDVNMTASSSEFERVDIDTVRTDSVTHVEVSDTGSNPRAVVFDGGRDQILVATHLSHTLSVIDPSTKPTSNDIRLQPNGSVNPVGVDEKNFFTFGRGFDFRETVVPGGELKTNNFTCGTCHVDGHLDGKIRFTVRAIENVPHTIPGGSFHNLGDVGKPVHVSTVFDMGRTEWMFFEGLKTIRDGIDPREPHTTAAPDERCGYCLFEISGFFFDTDLFTRELASPMSPYAPSGVLTQSQNEGRLLFEAMNCSRCHMGATRRTFPRTQEAAKNLPPGDPDFTGNGQFGPAPTDLEQENRLLHDPTQLFFKNDLRVCPPGTISHEFKNMSDVGTRNERDGQANGINTPALAGAWDNRPYMHDGRYRTLADVLENTFVDTNEGHRAAPLVFAGTPDNANGGVLPGDPCQITMDGPLFPFDVHRQYPNGAPPTGSLISVFDYATALGLLDELIDFLSAVSSETDLCTGEANIPTVLDDPFIAGDASSTFSWATKVPAQCRVLWGASQDVVKNEVITPLGTTHSVRLPTDSPGEYKVTVSAYTRGLCFDQPTIEKVWTVGEPPPATVKNSLAQNHPNPFSPTTSIAYSIQGDGNVRLTIYDVSGRLVRRLVNGFRKENEYVVMWNGDDTDGNPVSAGVYFYRLQTPTFSQTRKMILLR